MNYCEYLILKEDNKLNNNVKHFNVKRNISSELFISSQFIYFDNMHVEYDLHYIQMKNSDNMWTFSNL